MDAIFIPQLTKAPERTEEVQVKEFLPGLETLTPVRGLVRVQHYGNYLQVSAKAEAIITCTCNRCLQQYNQRLAVDTQEVIWLDEAVEQEQNLPLEREVAMEDLLETLSPNGYFYPSEWLYEQMCLALPQRQLCDINCPGILTDNSAESSDQGIDNRWSGLKALKKQLPG
ncbi:YceD family protein [Anabaena sp. CCY 9910]|uniref:YceD family protein n=1 Tax=Anabaena sp. CCY 9910 TaxID=3103870 RepID=UPI0039E1828A